MRDCLLIGRADDFATLGKLPDNFELHPFARADSGLMHQLSFPWFARNLHADVIHIPLNLVPIAMPRPYVVTVHDLSTCSMPNIKAAPSTTPSSGAPRHGLARASRVIAVSNATRSGLEDLLYVSPSRITQIYNAIDPQFLTQILRSRTAPGPRTLRHHLSLPALRGNIRPQKNIPRLIEAFAVVRDELSTHPVYKELRLVIIGDEISKHAAVRRAVIQTRTQASVRFLGFVPFETLRAFYEHAEVSPSPHSTKASDCRRSRRWLAALPWSPRASAPCPKPSATRPSW